MESMVIPYGIHDHSMWIPYGHSIWNDGMLMEYDHSIWIPYGIKVKWNNQNEWDPSQNIFHMEWMESTWNYMESMWNMGAG